MASVDAEKSVADPSVEVKADDKPTKKTKATKEKKPRVSKAPATHPPYLEMIVEAIAALKERAGSSQPAIAKYLEAKYKTGLPPKFKKVLSIQLKKFAEKKKLVQIKHSYKLAEGVKKPAKPVTAKPVTAKKPVKKAVVPKSPKPKTAKSAVKPKPKTVVKPKTAAKPKVVAKPKPATKPVSERKPVERKAPAPKKSPAVKKAAPPKKAPAPKKATTPKKAPAPKKAKATKAKKAPPAKRAKVSA